MSHLTPENHPLWAEYPITDHYELASGTVCQVPYYCRDAHLLILHGLADLGYLRSLLEGQNYRPISVTPERGVASLWIVEYRDTSCGPYNELILTLATSRKPLELSYTSPVDLLGASTHPDAMTFSYLLYLDQQVPIDYGREVHGIPKHKTPQPLAISFEASHCHFQLTHEGRAAMQGRVRLPQEPAAASRVSIPFVTPVNLLQTRNVMHCELAPRLRPMDREDSLSFSPETEMGRHLTGMRFEPRLVHEAAHVRFVMPKPLNWRSGALKA